MKYLIPKILYIPILFFAISANGQDNECIYDLETQTNGFLKETSFGEIHEWNNDNKTALIHISEYETLEILRGGCSHFNYFVTLTHYEDTADISDYKSWIK